MRNCFPYLIEEFEALSGLRVAVGLGSIGFSAIVAALREMGYALEPTRPKFGHGVEVAATCERRTIHVIASYHPSRQNTNTGVLTVPMFDAIFDRAKHLLVSSRDSHDR
jgi:uracil-DNA glycosylase